MGKHLHILDTIKTDIELSDTLSKLSQEKQQCFPEIQ